MPTYVDLPWYGDLLLSLIIAFAVFVVVSLFSLAWRLPDLVVAKRELAEAEAERIMALTELIKAKRKLIKQQTRLWRFRADRVEADADEFDTPPVDEEDVINGDQAEFYREPIAP